MKTVFFEQMDGDSMTDEVNVWLKANPDITIKDIKQSCLSPDAEPKDVETADYKPDLNSYIVVSIWYED